MRDFNSGNKCLSFIGHRHVMDLWRSKGGKDQDLMPWLTPAWRTELTTDVWEDVSTLSDNCVFIFFSFHKGCGLCFLTFSWIYQQIYLLLLPAIVYIQWVLWAWSVWGLTDGCICSAWLYGSEFDIQMSFASVFAFRNVVFGCGFLYFCFRSSSAAF